MCRHTHGGGVLGCCTHALGCAVFVTSQGAAMGTATAVSMRARKNNTNKWNQFVFWGVGVGFWSELVPFARIKHMLPGVVHWVIA